MSVDPRILMRSKKNAFVHRMLKSDPNLKGVELMRMVKKKFNEGMDVADLYKLIREFHAGDAKQEPAGSVVEVTLPKKMMAIVDMLKEEAGKNGLEIKTIAVHQAARDFDIS